MEKKGTLTYEYVEMLVEEFKITNLYFGNGIYDLPTTLHIL